MQAIKPLIISPTILGASREIQCFLQIRTFGDGQCSVVVPEDRAFVIMPPHCPDHRATQVFKTFAVAEQPHTEFVFERRFTQLRKRGQRREQVAIPPQSDLATGRVGVPNRHCDNQCIQES